MAIDCEMVGVGAQGVQSTLGRVSIVNWHGAVLLDTFVKPKERVVDYRTWVSGVSAEDLANGAPLTRSVVSRALRADSPRRLGLTLPNLRFQHRRSSPSSSRSPTSSPERSSSGTPSRMTFLCGIIVSSGLRSAVYVLIHHALPRRSFSTPGPPPLSPSAPHTGYSALSPASNPGENQDSRSQAIDTAGARPRYPGRIAFVGMSRCPALVYLGRMVQVAAEVV